MGEAKKNTRKAKKKYDKHEPIDGEKCNAFLFCLLFFGVVCVAAADFLLFVYLFELPQSVLGIAATTNDN